MDVVQVANDAAFQSALISGLNPDPSDNDFKMHAQLLRDVLGCKTGTLTNPIIINMCLCGHREVAMFRKGIRAADAAFLPGSRHVRHLFEAWWNSIESTIKDVSQKRNDEKNDYCWEQHDYMICLEPFADANGRTARVVYYMLARNLMLPIHIITASKASAYNDHKRRYRKEIFAPRMVAEGYIDA